MPHDGKKCYLIYKQSGSTIIAIDAPAHGLSSGKEFNIPQYAEFIDVVVQRIQTTTSYWSFSWRKNLFVLPI